MSFRNPFKKGDIVQVAEPDILGPSRLKSGAQYTVIMSDDDYVYIGNTDSNGNPSKYGTDGWAPERFVIAPNKTAYKKTDLAILFRIPAIEDVARVFQLGAQKYPDEEDFSWRSRPDKAKFKMEKLGSCLRHIFAHMQGELIDPEFGQRHLAHAAANLLMIMDVDISESK